MEFCHEEIKIHRGSHCLCPALSRHRHLRRRGMSQDWYLTGHFLCLEEKVQRDGLFGTTTTATVGGGEAQAHSASFRSQFGQSHAAGRTQ